MAGRKERWKGGGKSDDPPLRSSLQVHRGEEQGGQMANFDPFLSLDCAGLALGSEGRNDVRLRQG